MEQQPVDFSAQSLQLNENEWDNQPAPISGLLDTH